MNTESTAKYVSIGLTEAEQEALRTLATTEGVTEYQVLRDAVTKKLAEADTGSAAQDKDDAVWTAVLKTWHAEFGTEAQKPSEVLANRALRLKLPHDELVRKLPSDRKLAVWLAARLGKDCSGYTLSRVRNSRTRSWMYRVDKKIGA